MNCFFKKSSICLLLAVLFILTSCSGIMGYGVLLWDIPEHGLQDGDIVPVYIRSNISHVYVVSTPGSKEHFEIPLWQVTDPQPHHKAQRTARRYAEFVHQYAKVKIDGLPVRSDPGNAAKQVYRLRKNETVKLLYKGKGQAVMAGKTPLEGDWMRILTKDGTEGWCFSYNLDQFQTQKGGIVPEAQQTDLQEEKDTVIESVLTKTWYPDYYRTMIDKNRIDPQLMNASYCFTVDTENNKVSLNLPSIHESWEYSGTTKTGDVEYTFTGMPVKITVKSSSFIVVTYSGDNGKPRDLNFITLGEEEDVTELVAAEKERRIQECAKLYAFGPDFKSANYGRLSFKEDQSFSWKNYGLLVPSVVDSSAKNGGTLAVKFYLGDTLVSSYDGVLSFRFDGMDKDVNFLYKIENDGLRLEDLTGASYDGNTVTSRGTSPLVLFFQKD
ncbi:MAG: SH3 domain-containing protein [Treponema sp.]|nr:SH3 domain-containing protein [Treponema sp.]